MLNTQWLSKESTAGGWQGLWGAMVSEASGLRGGPWKGDLLLSSGTGETEVSRAGDNSYIFTSLYKAEQSPDG